MAEQFTNIYQLFQSFSWSNFLDINENQNYIKIDSSEDYLLKKEGNFFKITFYDLNRETKNIEKRSNYITLLIHKDLNPVNFINYWNDEEKNKYGYNFSKEHWIFKKVVEGINFVKISNNYQREIQKRGNVLFIQPEKFKELQKEIGKINKQASSSKTSILNFLVNQAKFEFLNKKTKRKTSVLKGDFNFLIHRLNLTTKKNKKDFLKYLDKADINSLGMLFDKMIKKEVFSDNYLSRLDDYFIKERLEDIIKNGRDILSLKTPNLETDNAIELMNNLFQERFGQLENVWQKYFEKYLLYLFFSYKKIVPKVELKNLEDLKKQYPDFIGVNHYDGVDIIEIKTHLKNILVWDQSHENFAFSPEMSKAIIQTINYMDAISNDNIKKTKDKKNLLDFLNIDDNLYRPRGIIIISSKDKICKRQNKLSEDQEKRLNKDFTKLRNSIKNIQIFTFDEILDIADNYMKNIIDKN